jgi:16S rRNA (uracil1498-N3)-methyltransferase
MSDSRASGFRPRFFLTGSSSDDPLGVELTLDEEDCHHARTVLRLQPGDACEVVVGAAVYAATVSSVDDRVKVRVQSASQEEASGGVYRVAVGLAQALARPPVMDFIFEKGTEVGVSHFVLFAAAGSPKWAASPPEDRLERWRRIVREAAKQSKQPCVPAVTFVGFVADALRHVDATGAQSVVLEPGASSGLAEVVGFLVDQECPGGGVTLWVGPEGGWTPAELSRFKAAGLDTAGLGRSILRTETAGPVAVAITRLSLADW